MFKQSRQSSTIQALVVKSKASGETDKIVTLISREKGRFLCTAKGVRQMKSGKKAYLESGNLTRVFLIETKNGWPLLTQANLICDCESVRSDLARIKQLMQFLEVIDKVIVEEELELEVFNKILLIRQMILTGNYPSSQIRTQLYELVEMLGFQVPTPDSTQHRQQNVLDYVAELTNQKMKSYTYLSVD